MSNSELFGNWYNGYLLLQNIYSVGLLLLIHMVADEADSSKEANIEHG